MRTGDLVPIYMVSRQRSRRVTLGEVTFHCVVEKGQTTLKKNVPGLSRSARQLGWPWQAGKLNFSHINALAYLTGMPNVT